MKLIEVDKILKEKYLESQNYNNYVVSVEDIENTPTIEAESVRHGKWLCNYKSHCSSHYQCSECGRRTGITQTRTYKYCPKCGAKMDLEESE